MTPEQAFEKWKNESPFTGYKSRRKAFLAGQQYQELHQIGVLADIRKAVGDPEGRLMWEDLVKWIGDLVSTIKSKEQYIKKIDGIIEEVGGVAASCISPYEDLKNALQGQKDLANKYRVECHQLMEKIRHLESVTTEKEGA